MLHAFYQKNTKQFKISPSQSSTIFYCQNDRLSASDRNYEGSIASCGLLPTCSVLTKSVTVSVLCKRWELFFVKPGVKVNGRFFSGISHYLNKC